MTLEEKRTQVAAQCKAVAHLAQALVEIHSDYEKLIESRRADQLIEQVGRRTAEWMDTLGNMLNAVDAVDDADKWLDPVFEQAHQLWPAALSTPSEK